MMKRAASLAEQVSSADPATGLRAVAALRRLLAQLEEIHVRNARGEGWTWQEIADAIGVSRQAVHKKYAASRIGPLNRRRDA